MAEKNIRLRIVADDQASPAFQRLSREMDRAGQQAQRTGSVFANLGQNILGAVTVGGAIALGRELYEVGRAASLASSTFTQLSGGANEAAANMDLLRAATGGIVDDMTLMQGSSKLLQMGLATTGQEVARLTELAVKLGGAMGSDATSSIENFALLLANQSVLRLDTFGISSARVRAEIQRLMETGEALNREDAFRMAVLSEGAVALDRLGSAADAAVTPIARLQARFENLTQAIGSGWADMLEANAALLEQFITIVSGGIDRLDFEVTRSNVVRSIMAGGASEQDAQAAFEQFNLMPGFTEFAQANITLPFKEILDRYVAIFENTNRELDIQVNQAAELMNMYARTGMPRPFMTQFGRMLMGPDGTPGVSRGFDERTMSAFSAQRMGEIALPGYGEVRNAMLEGQRLFEIMQANAQQMNTMGVGQAQNARDMADAMQRMYDRAQVLQERGMISQSQLDLFGQMAQSAADTADELERGADAIANMSLSAALASSNVNELLSGVMADLTQGMDTSGFSAKDLANIGLATGEQTLSSQAYDRLIAILQQRFAGQGSNLLEAGQKVEDILRSGRESGLTDAQIAAQLNQYGSFMQPIEVGQRGGRAGGGRAGEILGMDVSGAQQEVVTLSSGIEDAMMTLEEFDNALKDVTAQPRELTLTLNLDATNLPASIVELLKGELMGIVNGGNQQNNGKTPGTVPTGGKSVTSRPPRPPGKP